MILKINVYLFSNDYIYYLLLLMCILPCKTQREKNAEINTGINRHVNTS